MMIPDCECTYNVISFLAGAFTIFACIAVGLCFAAAAIDPMAEKEIER